MAKKNNIVVPGNAFYDKEGKVLAKKDAEVITPAEEEPAPPKPIKEVEKLEKGILYLIDDWIYKGHRLNIVGVFDPNGDLQGAMYIADQDGNPYGLPKPEEENGLIFNRLMKILGVPVHINDSENNPV